MPRSPFTACGHICGLHSQKKAAPHPCNTTRDHGHGVYPTQVKLRFKSLPFESSDSGIIFNLCIVRFYINLDTGFSLLFVRFNMFPTEVLIDLSASFLRYEKYYPNYSFGRVVFFFFFF